MVRLTACPLVPATLCLTPSAESGAPQALPLPADKKRIPSLTSHLSLRKAERKGERWGRNVSSLPAPAKRPEGVLRYWHFSSPDHLPDRPASRVPDESSGFTQTRVLCSCTVHLQLTRSGIAQDEAMSRTTFNQHAR